MSWWRWLRKAIRHAASPRGSETHCVAGVRGLELANVVSKRYCLNIRANSLAFQNILGPEIFRGKAANNLTRRSGAKTRQFEIGCPLGALMRHLENQLCCVAKKLQHIGRAY